VCGPLAARSSSNGPGVGAPGAGAFFSLLDEQLRLGTEGYSPRVVRQIEFAGGNHTSFTAASRSLQELAELSISPKQVERISERLGRERGAERDAAAQQMQAGELKQGRRQPPAVVAIHLDAGKMQFRAEGSGPGVHEPAWGDAKVACLQSYTKVNFDKDPQPQPPAAFVDRRRVEQLCREMERVGSTREPQAQGSKKPMRPETKPERRKEARRHRRQRPQRVKRTVVATTRGVEDFGWMVAAEAMMRGFYATLLCAIVGDGGNWIGPMADLHFPGWVQILDFPHLLVHLYAAARLSFANQPRAAWALYEKMLRDAWAGRARQVLQTLQEQVERLGPAPPGARKDDFRNVVRRVRDYVQTNMGRMNYPSYRQKGLPISSALVESLIKQMNQRVKGTEKFWNETGGEAILQVRAAYLSEDERAETFHSRRPRGPAVGRNRRKIAA
jgi:hypothetical protein